MPLSYVCVVKRTMKTDPGRRRTKDGYHHGDLHRALLQAAEAELADKGVEGFSLRGVAKRAGVSHAAPAHHFGDANGLLTALAAEGFRRLMEAQRVRQQKAGADGLSRLVAAGHGYIAFAMEHPALFRLMFSSDRPDHGAPALRDAAAAAFYKLVDDVRAVHGPGPADHDRIMSDVMAAWAMVHGLADLMNAGRLRHLLEMPEAARDAAIAEMLRRVCG